MFLTSNNLSKPFTHPVQITMSYSNDSKSLCIEATSSTLLPPRYLYDLAAKFRSLGVCSQVINTPQWVHERHTQSVSPEKCIEIHWNDNALTDELKGHIKQIIQQTHSNVTLRDNIVAYNACSPPSCSSTSFWY